MLLQSCRKGRSVTPAIGATTRLFLSWKGPICIARAASTIDVFYFTGEGVIVIAARAKKKQFARIFFSCVATNPHTRRRPRDFPSNHLAQKALIEKIRAKRQTERRKSRRPTRFGGFFCFPRATRSEIQP